MPALPYTPVRELEKMAPSKLIRLLQWAVKARRLSESQFDDIFDLNMSLPYRQRAKGFAAAYYPVQATMCRAAMTAMVADRRRAAAARAMSGES